MNIKLICTVKARARLSKNLLERMQSFTEIQAHDDWALSSIAILRRASGNDYILVNSKNRYSF